MKIITKIFFCLFASASSAALLIVSFPNYNQGWLAWIAFVPLLLAIHRKKPWQAFLICWFCGIGFNLGMTTWIKDFPSMTLPGKLLIYPYLGLYYAFFGSLLSFFQVRINLPRLAAAPLWVLLEYIRSNLFFLGFPSFLLGQTQYLNLPLIQLASFTGVYGISFLVMLSNAAVTDLILHWIEKKMQVKPRLLSNLFYRAGGIFFIIAIIWVAGWHSLSKEPNGKSFSVAVIQGNIPQERKWDRQFRQQIISQHERLTEIAAESKPQVIVWPEASTPGLILKDITLYQQMVSMVRRINTYLLVGSAEYPKFDKEAAKLKRSGNTALFFSPQGKILGQYIKIRLVPFGEYIPLEGKFPWPEFIASKGMASHVNGTELVLFQLDGTQFCTLICWEILFPQLSRSMVRKGAQFIVNISNEAWFGKSAASHQILAMSVFRAVENRINLVRSTNTGVSCFIDPYGRITGRIAKEGNDLFIEGTLTQKIILSPVGTFYTHYGDIFAIICIGFSLSLIIVAFLKRK